MIACDAVLRRGVAEEDLWRAVEPMANWPGVKSARAGITLADSGAESILESLTRELVHEAGIGEPETQFPVRTTRGIAWCDIRVGNHFVEADGEVKLTPIDQGGLSEDPQRTLFEEKLRHRAVCDRGLVGTRVVWEDQWGRRRAEAVERLRRDHAESVERFGPELAPHLAREAEEIRRKYGDRRPQHRDRRRPA